MAKKKRAKDPASSKINFAEIKKEIRKASKPRYLIVLVLLVPIILLLAGDPQTFALNWGWEGQIGRGSFLFLAFFLGWEWFDSKKGLPQECSRKRLIVAVSVFVAVCAFYAARVFPTQLGLDSSMSDNALRNFGLSLGAGKGTDSFPLAIDYIVYIILAFVETLTLLGFSGFKAITTPVVFSAGIMVLVLLDAFFPYDSLAFMQNWVGVIWQLVVAVLAIIGVRIASSPLYLSPPPAIYLIRNSLLVNGNKGFMNIVIYWPSSGLVSMVIFSTIIAIFVIKMETPLKRKMIYAAIGALGTFFVNVLRISMIVAYVMFVSLDVEAFHQVIGEILFLIWIVVYLLLVIRHEGFIPQKPISNVPTYRIRTGTK